MENIEKQNIELSNVLETSNKDNTVIENIPETEALVGDKQHICINETPDTAAMGDSSSACQCCSQKNWISSRFPGSRFAGLLNFSWENVKDFVEALAMNGEERIHQDPLNEEDFELESEFKVAKYAPKSLKKHWNTTMIYQPLGRRTWSYLKHGVLKRTFPMLLVFLIIYYFISIFILSQICCQPNQCENDKENGAEFCSTEECGLLDDDTKGWIVRRVALGQSDFPGIQDDKGRNNVTYFCNNFEQFSGPWSEKEHRLTRVLTFLVGFYVSFVIRNWWRQAEKFPTLDKMSLAMGSFVFVDSSIDESAVKVKVGNKIISLLQLKKDIFRLALLSYAMCFCRISTRLKNKLPDAQAFIEKGLMTKGEYKVLQENTKSGWLVKWVTPQLWINRIACSVDGKNLKKLTENKDIEDIDNRVKIESPKEIGISLFKLKDDLQRMNNQYYFRVPSLMRQVILIALYFYILLGAMGGQGKIFHMKNDMNIIVKLISNFPLFYIIKQLLLIGWLRTATDLQNPFGDDK